MYLYGSGGHCKVLLDLLELNNIEVAAIIDDDPKLSMLLGYEVKTSDSLPRGAELIVSIGSNRVRMDVANRCMARFINAFHPNSYVSKRAQIGVGTVVMAGAVVNSHARIGEHCIINTNATIEHDCTLEDFVHVSPNATLAGNVKVGIGTHIGIAACILPGVIIGNWVTVGAGAVVTKDISDGSVVIGNPATLKQNRS